MVKALPLYSSVSWQELKECLEGSEGSEGSTILSID
jgi:hypothetical protein